jgi:hypothetical protein
VRPTAGLETAGKKHLPLPGFVSRLYGCPTHSWSILRGPKALVSAKKESIAMVLNIFAEQQRPINYLDGISN